MKITFRSTFLRALLIAGGLSLSAHAATLTVTTAADELNVPAGANLSLREAVRDAAAGDTIVFTPALSGQTITLTPALGGEIVIGKNVTIDASSLPAGVTISGGGTSRIFFVSPGQSLTLTGLTLTGGNGVSATSSGFGGAIMNTGLLTLTRCSLVANSAASSGAGFHNTGTATVDACTFSGNSAQGSGGAINSQTTLTVTSSTFSGNTAAGTTGGGGAVNGANDPRTNVSLESCTLVGNSATGASGAGGGVRQVGGTVTIKNCIVAGNTATVPLTENLAGTITQTGANLTSGDPLVAPLGNYGGLTQTRPPLAGSPAINASVGSAFTTDQRGFPVFGVVDLGAAESAVVVTTTTDELNAASLSGSGISLREAVRDTPSGGAIVFAPALSGLTITLAPVLGGEIVIGKNVTIDASSLPAGVIISSGGTRRIFSVSSGQALTLTGLTLTGGNGAGAASSGFGGAIFNTGLLTLTRCSLVANSATNSGGGVHNAGTATVDACTFSGNSTDGSGGGFNCQGTATVTRCTFSGNTAAAASGGGGAMNGTNSPASNVSLESCTLVGNSATGASGTGGGVRQVGGTVTTKNCIVAGNTATVPLTENLAGTITQTGANLTSGDPLVAPLGNYGGPTQTRPPLLGSPAINASVGSAFTTDQRGFPVFGVVDLGAAESAVVVTTTTDELNAASLSGSGISLREAVRDTPSGGAVGFAPALSGSTLGMSEIVIDKNVTIDASSLPAGVTLSAGTSSRLFFVNISGSLALTGLRLRDGNGASATSNGFGGAIANAGTLALTRCTLTANSAANAGGAVHSSGTATVDACTFVGNSAQLSGGAINSQATLTVTRSTFSGNTAAGTTVGGGAVNGTSSTAVNVSLESCTLVGNSATGSSGAGGGVRRVGGTVTIKNCIVAGNTATTVGTENLAGTITQTGANLTSGDPLVAPLINYGGPTATRALLPDSPARNAAVGSTFTSDQRGFPIVGTADLGAYEAGTLAMNYNAYIWESLPTVGNGTASDPLHAQTYDYDGDGVTNVNEWLAQTSAADSLSYLRFTSVVRGPTALEFTYPSVLGRNYQYEVSPDLVTWFPLTGDTGTGAPITLFVTPGAPSGFIRVRVGP